VSPTRIQSRSGSILTIPQRCREPLPWARSGDGRCPGAGARARAGGRVVAGVVAGVVVTVASEPARSVASAMVRTSVSPPCVPDQ
jgi:hypothetical protein